MQSRSKLDLPAPDAPSSQRKPPSGMAKLRSCNASVPVRPARSVLQTHRVETNHWRATLHALLCHR